MTDDQINIAIAEACGWQECCEIGNLAFGIPKGFRVGTYAFARLPDYCNDLNAMHEAEEALEPMIHRKKFPEILAQVMASKEGFRTNGLPLPLWWQVHCGARQRAEAFLRTIGKWEGGRNE